MPGPQRDRTMSARDDFDRWSDEGEPQLTVCSYDALTRTLAEIDALRSAMRVLGKVARIGSDMLAYLRESEGVQEWHEDKLDDIDRCIAAIENAPAWVRTPA